jgi:hypothetical protein
MANDNEIPIGAVRPDGTEKPEAEVLAGYAAFVGRSPQSFTKIVPPEVTMVTSQVELYSTLGGLALDTQKKALRAMAYSDHTPIRMLPENRLAELGTPKLVFLPSAQGLTEAAWQRLLEYVAKGGTLLVTGPLNRDEHWVEVDRLGPLGVKAEVMPLAVRGSTLEIPDNAPLPLSFPPDVQQSAVETMRFENNVAMETIEHGSGRILWTADPVEFSEGYATIAALYRYALKAAKVEAPFQEISKLSPNVLAFPTFLEDVDARGAKIPGPVLYTFSNESLDPEGVGLRDALTGAMINFTLGPQRGAALLLDREGKVLASYGGAGIAR